VLIFYFELLFGSVYLCRLLKLKAVQNTSKGKLSFPPLNLLKCALPVLKRSFFTSFS
jgi:hypothetical protein